MAQIVKRSFDSNIWKLLCKNIPYRHKNATFISDRRFHSKSTFISRTEATVAADQHQQCGQDERARLKMSAWQIHDYGDIQELQYSENVKIPQILQANECLIKVLASSVNPIDVMMLNGYGANVLNILRGQTNAIEFPLTLGREFCGILLQKGMKVNNTKDLQLGERVWGVVPLNRAHGSHAECVVVPDYCISSAPSILGDEEAASVLYAGLTAWSGLYITAQLGGICGATTSCGGGANQRILVLGGSGGVGSLAIQMLRAQCAQVVATCSTDAVEMVKNLGANCVIDYTVDRNELNSKLARFAPYDVILDCAGRGPDGADDLENVSYSQYVTFSSPLLRLIDNSGLGMGVLKNAANLLETNVKSLSKRNGLVKWGFFVPDANGIEFLRNLVERKKLLPIVETTYDYQDLPKAYERVLAGHLRGKIAINMKPSKNSEKPSP